MGRRARLKVWDGVYPTFKDTEFDCAVFKNDVWIDKIVARAQSAMAEFRDNVRVPPFAETRDYALPFVAALVGSRDRPLRILDFGGGMGVTYLALAATLPADQKLEYVIVENEEVCNRARELFAGDNRVTFRSHVPSSSDRFDIIHCGSSLHYVDDWCGMLNELAAYEPAFMLFADLPAAENRTFVTTQAYYGRRIPVWFWNLRNL